MTEQAAARRTPTELMTVGEVAQRAGVAVSALHFYERLGLITSERTAGNQRRYHRYVLRRISLIQVAKRIGIPLAEVKAAFDGLPGDRMPAKRDWERISATWRAHLEARRLEIERLENEMTGCIGCGCVSLRECTVLNPGDVLAADGTGARLLLPIDEEQPSDD